MGACKFEFRPFSNLKYQADLDGRQSFCTVVGKKSSVGGMIISLHVCILFVGSQRNIGPFNMAVTLLSFALFCFFVITVPAIQSIHIIMQP